MKKRNGFLIVPLIAFLLIFSGFKTVNNTNIAVSKDSSISIIQDIENSLCDEVSSSDSNEQDLSLAFSDIPNYSGEPYIVINGNQPFFTDTDLTTSSFEMYSSLDYLGRCGVAYANIGTDIMPTKDREAIGQIKPSGWHTVKYEFIDGKYLYNRCHLIGYQLSAENANECNLITGTRYLNTQGMLPFENMVADYVVETNNHVLYRVTPIFDGDSLLASGVLMEAYSVEDNGNGICYNVFCYNIQPGISIDYTTGDSYIADSLNAQANGSAPMLTLSTASASLQTTDYIGNRNTKKFHKTNCRSVSQMDENNKVQLLGTRDEILQKGYFSCRICNP